jgi:hypothetical protein
MPSAPQASVQATVIANASGTVYEVSVPPAAGETALGAAGRYCGGPIAGCLAISVLAPAIGVSKLLSVLPGSAKVRFGRC